MIIIMTNTGFFPDCLIMQLDSFQSTSFFHPKKIVLTFKMLMNYFGKYYIFLLILT